MSILSAIVQLAEQGVVGSDPRDQEGFELLTKTIDDELADRLSPPGPPQPFQFRDLRYPLYFYRAYRPRPWLLPVALGGLIALGIVIGRATR